MAFIVPQASLSPIRLLPAPLRKKLSSTVLIPTASVALQELVENAVDAKASRVHIHVHGKRLVVRDDGHGISREDLGIAACAHSTSKIYDERDLADVGTLGFRGLGLWGIAARSGRLEICSRRNDELDGSCVVYGNDGEVVERRGVAMGNGTTVSVDTNEMKMDVKEMKQRVMHCALCHPGVKFVASGEKWVWNNFGNGRRQMVARELKREVESFREVRCEIEGIGHVEMIVGLPGMVWTSSKKWMIIAVNGRVVQDEALCEQVSKLLSVKPGRHGVFFIHIHLRPDLVDWTSCMRKTVPELGATKPKVHTQILNTISSTLGQTNLLPSLFQTTPWHTPKPTAPKILGQALSRYIITETAHGIQLLEQHVADERARYETLLTSWHANLHPLNPPLQLPLSEHDAYTLTTLGLHLQELSPATPSCTLYQICTLPKMMHSLPPTQLPPLIHQLCKDPSLHHAAAQIACRTAVRNGTALTQAQMERIVSAWNACENKHVCPHGRRIVLNLPSDSMRLWFDNRAMPGAASEC